jgi:tetratricopeptide (TPR) repeat protein
LLLGLGAISKEPAVAMAGVFLLVDLWFGEKLNWMAAARNWRLFGAMTVAGIAAVGKLYEIASREGTAGATAAVTRWDYLVTQFKVIWTYVRMVVLPVGQNLDHAYPATKAPGDLLAWFGLAGLAAVVVGAFVWRRRYPVATLGALMFLVLLTPTSSIVPIDDTMAERRVYLGFVGLAAIAAEGVSRMKRDPARLAGLGVVLLVLTAATAARSSDYASGEAMWASSVKANPSNGRARFQLGYAYYRDGRCREAATEYGESARNGKTDYRLLVDWALALDCAGESEGALEKLRQATTLERDSHAWSVMGMVLGKRKEPEKALEALAKALELNPGDDAALMYRGNVYLMQGEREKALQDYESALRINPSNDGAQQGRRAAQSAEK